MKCRECFLPSCGSPLPTAPVRTSKAPMFFLESTLLPSRGLSREAHSMSRSALLLGSTTADRTSPALQPARRLAPATSLGKLVGHTRDAWQVLLLFSYLLAAMTPQVRRALS